MHVVLARYCYRMSSVRPFVRLSHNIANPKGTPLKFVWNRGEVALLRKPAISLKRDKIGPRLLLMTNRKWQHVLSIGAKINDLGWPWRAFMHYGSKHVRLWVPSTKIWMNIDYALYCQRRRCSPMTLHSDNIRFMRIFAGFPGKGASYNSEVIENVFFSGFRTLRIRHLRKWGQY